MYPPRGTTSNKQQDSSIINLIPCRRHSIDSGLSLAALVHQNARIHRSTYIISRVAAYNNQGQSETDSRHRVSFITIALLGSAGLIEGVAMGMSRERLSNILEKRQSETCLASRLKQLDLSSFASRIPTCLTTYALMEYHPPHRDILTASTRFAKFQRISQKNRVNTVLASITIIKAYR
jgi:hypothetical protein